MQTKQLQKVLTMAVASFMSLSILFTLGAVPSAQAAPESPATITILHTNDFHGQLELAGSNPGSARLAQVVNNVRITVGTENVLLLDAGDTKLATGTLSSANFKVGTAAADANDYIVYNNSTGALYYDADGSGATAANQFATVYASGTTPATLSAAEFVGI